ncbi:MAG TPA: Fe-S-containing protein, partial [Fusobacterium sp.]|uniref:Fe-S-containing protein n=1 Tax=Fusobacterium sp. TaxID=68766 RepID=UPI002F3FC1A8
ILIAVISFLGISLTTAMIVFKQLYPQKMVKISLFYNRLSLSMGMIFMLFSVLFFIFTFLQQRKFISVVVVTSGIATHCLAFTILPQVYALTKEFVAFGENSFGTQSLLRLGGYSLGILTVCIMGLAVYKMYFRFQPRYRKCFALFIFLIVSMDFILRGVSALARLRFLKASNSLVFEIMILEDKGKLPIFAMFLCAVCFSLLLFVENLKVKGNFSNRAILRKEKARLKNNRSWSLTLFFSSILVIVSVTFVHSYINKPVELTPAQPYQEEGNKIIIPLTDVEDGHLHRFSYQASGGHDVRFIVVKKPKGGSYGVGLDACDICGVAGYYERNDDVVCKRCDVVMNKSTIGFKGGCNPVPFEYEIIDKKIIIDKAVLEQEKDRFPVGE